MSTMDDKPTFTDEGKQVLDQQGGIVDINGRSTTEEKNLSNNMEVTRLTSQNQTSGDEEERKKDQGENEDILNKSGCNFSNRNPRLQVSASNSPAKVNVEELEGRKLEIRLARLPEQNEEALTTVPVPVPPPIDTSATTNQNKVLVPVVKRNLQKAQKFNEARRHQLLLSRKRAAAAAMKRKNVSSTSTQQVKIKMNFWKKKLASKNELNLKSSNEIDFEAKERDAAAEASLKMIESRAKSVEAAAQLKETEDVKRKTRSLTSCSDNENTSHSSEDEKDDSSFADEYDYRPMRAAAAAALEAVHGKRKVDVESIRGKQFWKQSAPKGKSRRCVMKRDRIQKGIDHCVETFGFQMLESMFHNDVYYQLGDIVSVTGEDDKETYFCQISQLMKDHRNRDLVELIWLTPNTRCPAFPFYLQNYDRRDDFQPITVTINHCEFVMHCPHDYFTRPGRNNLHPAPLKGLIYKRLYQAIVIDDYIIKQEVVEVDEAVPATLKPHTADG